MIEYKNIKLKKKLVIAFLSIIVMCTIPISICIYTLFQMRKAIIVSNAENIEAVLFKELKSTFTLLQLSEHKYLLTGDVSSLDESGKMNERLERLFKKAISAVDDEEEETILHQIEVEMGICKNIFGNIKELHQQHKQLEAFRLLSHEHKSALQRTNNLLDGLLADSSEDTKKAVVNAGEHSESAVNLMALSFAMAVASVFFGVFLAIGLARSIANPVNSLKNAAEKISMGDLSVTVDVDQKDEIGELALSFRRMLIAVRFFAPEMKKRTIIP